MQRFIRKSFAVSKKYTYLCGDSFHHASHLHSDQGGTFAFYNSTNRTFKDGTWWDFTYAPLTFEYKAQKLQEKFGNFEYSAYLCNNNKRKESYMETKDKKIQVHTIDYKDIDKFFPARSEITMSPLPKGHIARLATIHKVKIQ